MLLPATASSRHGLQLAVLATYDLRMDWLYSLFPKGLPVTLILPPPKEDYRTDPSVARPGLHRSEIFGDFARCPGWQICVPSKPKGGWLTQHMKFLILVHPDFLRVAILSGNLNGIDWERIENTAYIQDFPLNTDTAKAATPAHGSSQGRTNDFKAQLVRILRSLGMPSSHPVYAALDRHDFSQATRARIVASWPEASNLAEWDRMETQGLGRLGKVVRDLGIQPKRSGSLQLECQGSSLANHDIKWIEHFPSARIWFQSTRPASLQGQDERPAPGIFQSSRQQVGITATHQDLLSKSEVRRGNNGRRAPRSNELFRQGRNVCSITVSIFCTRSEIHADSDLRFVFVWIVSRSFTLALRAAEATS